MGHRRSTGETSARPWAGGPKPKLAAHDEGVRARVLCEPDATLAENTSLAMKFNVKHFPTLVALRPDGTEFARLEYNSETLAQMTTIVKGCLARFEDPAPAAASAPGVSQDTVAR